MPVVERLRRRFHAPPQAVVDALIAVLCYLTTIALPVKVFHAGGWRMLVLAGLASVPLVWRRRAPVVVAAVVGVGTMGLAFMGILRSVPLPYGQVVATYTVAALASPLWRLVVMATTIGATAWSVLIVFEQRTSILALATLPFIVAYALGVGLRARRDRIAMLEERTRRLAETAEATAVRERERIAREIHDIVAHSVSLMVVQAEAGLQAVAQVASPEVLVDAVAVVEAEEGRMDGAAAADSRTRLLSGIEHGVPPTRSGRRCSLRRETQRSMPGHSPSMVK